MGATTSKLAGIVISNGSFRLSNNPWNGWELEEQNGVRQAPSNSVSQDYRTGTPGIIIGYCDNGDLQVVVDGKEFTLTAKQVASGWEVKKPLKGRLFNE